MNGPAALPLLPRPRCLRASTIAAAWLLCGVWAHAAAEDGRLELSLGVAAVRMDMREFADSGDTLVRELGTLPGLTLGLSYGAGPWQLLAEWTGYDGTLDYDGQTQSGTTFATRTDTRRWSARLRALRTVDDAARVALGFGLGYGQWQRHIRGHSGVSGLDERYTSGFLSVDARLSLLRAEANSVDLDLRLAQPLRPEVRVDFGGRYDTQALGLGSRLAARVSLPASWTTGPRSRVVVEPGFEAWGFGRSDTETLYRAGVPVGVVYQPQIRGYDLDLKLTWVRSF